MAFWNRKRDKGDGKTVNDHEERGSIENPSVPLNPANFADFGSPSKSGVYVDEETALTFSAVYACVRIRSEILASFPLNLYKRTGLSKELAIDHPIYPIIHREPCEMYTSFDWRQLMEASVMLWGNGYSKIVRDRRYNPVWLDFIHPSLVKPYQIIRQDGTKGLMYEIKRSDGRKEKIEAVDMIHCKGPSFDGISGKSPIELARESIGLGLANEQFGAEFFANGAAFSGTLNTANKLTPEQANRLREQWNERNTGSGNRWRTPVLESGLEFKAIGIPPEQAQWIASRKFQLEEVARWYGIPLHMLANLDRSSFSNIEHQGIEFVTVTMGPRCVSWEQELDRKLLREVEKNDYFTRFNMDSLLRGDSTARAAFLTQLVGFGIYTRNEARAYEDKNPLEGLDEPLTPANLMNQQAKDLKNGQN
jgi:HK97 family phage portal protein